ncbi:DGQHR domain-containing protein [Roseateles sp. DAIF2]|uniref:DGQHR domain-containing protein n=1 Tax=Roseateles sp. DAIF2 TaxID=2714952 RepID=UPI0018A24B6A|nr:DGQHR domain-containing protein [Roseateles sp. DAIF2]QPF71464.1 DGQHR domain-containing protein [Roseateles sp. DAIF2]
MSTLHLSETLKSRFSANDLALSASLGVGANALKEKFIRLFSELSDPLITAQEAIALLNVSVELGDAISALEELRTEGFLEKSTSTQRALDKNPPTLYRLKESTVQRLKLFGIASKLDDGAVRLQFTIDGRLIRSFAAVDRLDVVAGTGNQRDEIYKHVSDISNGMRDGVQVPNSVIVVFNEEVFSWAPSDDEVPESWVVCRQLSDWSLVKHPTDHDRIVQEVCPVELDIPFRNAAFDEEKTAYLVDGQQRTAALSLVDIDAVPSFFLTVNALVGSQEEAKNTFRIANSTVRITTDFARALLGTLDETPGYVREEKRVAQAVKTLAIDDKNSPFYGLVKHPGVDGKGMPIVYNTLFSVVATFNQSGIDFGEGSEDLAHAVAKAYSLVAGIWPEAWGKSSKDSKLSHGAGLRAIGKVLVDLLRVQTAIHGGDLTKPEAWAGVEASLKRLRAKVLWSLESASTGNATQLSNYKTQLLPRQNTNQDIQQLTTFLQKEVVFLDKKAKDGSA